MTSEVMAAYHRGSALLSGVRDAMEGAKAPADASIVIPLEIQPGKARLSFFSSFATIGTPQDVTLEELCLESLFPADEETERMVREIASSAS